MYVSLSDDASLRIEDEINECAIQVDSNEHSISDEYVKTICKLSPGNSRTCVSKLTKNEVSVQNGPSRTIYSFDDIFPPNATQEEFAQLFLESVKCFCQGMSQTILTLGSSGSGKTYTMLGSSEDDTGLVGNVLIQMLSALKKTQKGLLVTASEVTIDGVNDLFARRRNFTKFPTFSRSDLVEILH